MAYDFWSVQPITAMRTPIICQLMMSTFDLGAFQAERGSQRCAYAA